MRPSFSARALSAVGLLCLGYLRSAHGAPIPQTETKPPAAPRSAQAQIMLAAGSYSYRTIKVWDLASLKEKVTFYGQSPVQNVSFSPDGTLLVQGAQEGIRLGKLSLLAKAASRQPE